MQINQPLLQKELEQFNQKVHQGLRFKQLKFSIMHGNGNVILVLDEKRSQITADHITPALAQSVCEFFHAVRIDGIAFLRIHDHKVKMTFFDRNGTAEPMCGNGLRCSAHYAYQQGYLSADSSILTDDGEKKIHIVDVTVHAALGPGREFQKVADNQYFVFSSVPHLVVFVDDLAVIDVKKQGAILRYDPHICQLVNHPEGVHVDFLKEEADHIQIRTYEVGVEDETLSCGSGAAGCAYVAHKVKGYSYPIRVQTNCGDIVVNNNEHGLVISGIVEYLYSNIK
jgi:diaminopimelate epimerase